MVYFKVSVPTGLAGFDKEFYYHVDGAMPIGVVISGIRQWHGDNASINVLRIPLHPSTLIS